MNIQELMFTDMVLERAKELRKLDHSDVLDDPSVEPPNLEPYVKRAVKDLEVWRKVVMEQLNSD